MRSLKELFRRLLYVGRRSRFDHELDDEIRFHIEARAEELAQSGLPAVDAFAQARREFGSPIRIRESSRAAWQFRWLEDGWADLRYAARSVRRNPTFALTAILCLALGIGANTTIFSVAAEVLFSEPSSREPRSLVHLEIGGSSHALLRDYRFIRDAGIFEGLAGENEESEVNWRHGEASDRLFAVRVTENFFDVIGAPVAIGRPIQAREPNVVVLTDHFWRRRLAGDPNVLGRTLTLDGRVHTVVGVLPRDHRTVTGFGFAPDLYVPVADEATIVALYARLAPGMTRAAAYARLKSTCEALDQLHPEGTRKRSRSVSISAISGLERLQTEPQLMPVAAFFAMLMVIVGLVLLMACANVASLLLARASARAHELAVRLSIGASRGRIVRQLLTESLLLACCGTAAGLALNAGLTALLSRIRLPLPLPIQFVIQPDWRLLGYATAVALVSSVASGLLPALRTASDGVTTSLKRGEHQVDRGQWTMRHVLVAGQLAVSIVLLSASLIFARNLMHASAMNPGFDLQHTLWAEVRLVPEAHPSRTDRRAFIESALESLRAAPGVEATTIAGVVPLNGAATRGVDLTTDATTAPVHVQFHVNHVGPDYFRALGIPIVLGREFLASDGPASRRVAILNENMAQRLFGRASAIDRVLRFEQGPPITIVGVARNSKYFTLGEDHVLAYYEPYAQWMGPIVNLHFLVRTAGAPDLLVRPINAVLGQLDSTAAVEVKPMRDALVFALLPSRVGAVIVGAAGVLGTALAAIGLYGALFYAVSRRIREIGLRVALGASPRGILTLVLRQSLALVAVAVAIGIGLTVVAVRPLTMFLLPEVRPTDPVNFLSVCAALCAVAVVATISPAVMALRVNPVVALRHD